MAVKAKLLFGILMVIIYLGMGCMLAFSDIFDIGRPVSIIIGVLMILYGVFRGVRIYQSM